MEFANVNMVVLLVVTFLVTAGIKSLSTLLGKDLSGTGAALTAALVGLILGIFNSVLVPMIPPSALPFIEPAANILVMVLGAFGIQRTVKAFQSVTTAYRSNY